MKAGARPGAVEAVRSTIVELEGGATLRALESGAGAPVVLIHGAMALAEDMALPLFEPLARAHRVLSVDRPGHGHSLRPRFASAPMLQATQIRAGMRELGVERPIVVAHSVGGPVALSWARAWPEEVRGLVLLAPLAYPEFRPMEHTYLLPRAAPGAGPALSRVASGTWDTLMVPLMDRAMFLPQEIPDRWRDEVPHELIRRPEQLTANGEDSAQMPALAELAAAYRSIPTPTIILTGNRDLVVSPNRHARPLSVALPDARLEVIDGLGHMLHHFAPERVVAAVEALDQRR